MASSDWLLLASTALGGILAAGSGLVTQLWASHRADVDARNERRRSAYTSLIAAQEELKRTLVASGTTLRASRTAANPLGSDVPLGRAVAQGVGSVARACVAVSLAGPQDALVAGERVQDAAWKMDQIINLPSELTESFLSELGGKDFLDELSERTEKYIDACNRFIWTAQKILDVSEP